MRAITVKQPWAHAIIHLGKDIENRPSMWRYRGPIAIHAGKADDGDGYWDVRIPVADRRGLARGAVIGVADLTGCHPARPGCCDSQWAQDAGWHLTLARPRALNTPVPARGMLGPWNLPPDVEASVLAQLGGADHVPGATP